MSVSPSQCVTIERCNRLWWFEKVARLYVPSSKPQSFGHALHKLCLSYLSGGPLDPAWADELTGDEVESCLGFRDKAIERGVLVHRDGLLCEHEFRIPIGDREMHGIIDCLDLGTTPESREAVIVEDHKVISSARWGRTQADLLVDIPMMIYAGYAFSRATQQEAILRHNQFIMESGGVTYTQVRVTRAQVKDFWRTRVMPLLRTMDATRGVEQWDGVVGHERLSNACTAYGGCPFAAICHGGLPIEQFQSKGPEKNGAPF